MLIIVTGATGKLGRELVRIFPDCLHPDRKELDITDRRLVDRYVRYYEPEAIVHAAALTGVRQCEEDRYLAWKTNVDGTENVVEAVEKNAPGCRFLYISTACVFGGDRGGYTERDIPYPSNFYALTKLLGEILAARLPNHLVVRTNFVTKDKWPYPKAFTDRFGTYLFADDVAVALTELLEAGLTGIVHVVGDKKMSMFELAKLTTPNVEPMTVNEYEGPPLTIDMTLDTIRWRKYRFKIDL